MMTWKMVALTFALAVTAADVAHAQDGRIEGVVVAEGSQRPLVGVQILVNDQPGKGGLTDASGRFRISGVADATVVLNARMIGYRPVT